MKEGDATLALHRMVRLSDLKPNPFRDMTEFPIHEDKVEALIGSINKDGYWNNIEARPAADGIGYEIAYGHHRVEALRRVFGPDAEVAVMVEDFTNDAMIRRMANENLTDWASPNAEREAVRAVVRAFANGEVTLDQPDPKTSKTHLRIAPSFAKVDAPKDLSEHAYTADTLASYLGQGWEASECFKVRSALGQLEELERGAVSESDLRGKSRFNQAEIVAAARRAEARASMIPALPKEERVAVAREVSEALARKMEAKEASYKGRVTVPPVIDPTTKQVVEKSYVKIVPTHEEATDAAIKEALAKRGFATGPGSRKKEAPPSDLARSLYSEIDSFFTEKITRFGVEYDGRGSILDAIATYRDDPSLKGIALPWADQIADRLDDLADDAAKYAALLRAGKGTALPVGTIVNPTTQPVVIDGSSTEVN